MVNLTTLAVAALALGQATAIEIRYNIKYYGAGGQGRYRQMDGRTVSEAQTNRILSNIFLWSQGNFIAARDGDRLLISNVRWVRGRDASDTVLHNMQQAIEYHVFGAGASH